MLAEAKEEYAGSDGYRVLSNNPLNNQFIASGGVINSNSEESAVGRHEDGGILIWKLDSSITQDNAIGKKVGGPTKRLKSGIPTQIAPHGKIACSGGLSSLKWSGPSKVFAGCLDHSLKVIDVDRLQV